MKRSYLILTILYCAGIFWLSAQSSPPHPGFFTFPGDDKVAHTILYAGLAWTVSMGLRRADRPVSPAVQFWAPIVFASLYGMTDEFHQHFVPNRTMSAADWAADTTGPILMQLVLCLGLWRLHPFGNREI